MFSSLEEAWALANTWWQAGPSAFLAIEAPMRARIGYHNMSHIERMLDRYRQLGAEPNPRLIGWIFAHDLVYVPGAPDNESESATQMDLILRKAEAKQTIARDDRTAIESTRTHQPVDPATLNGPDLVPTIHLLHDLDLEILAAGASDYDRYRQSVYAEYLAASNDPTNFPEVWREGRTKFLQAMLARPQIFKTSLFAMLEKHARDNMQAELREGLEATE